jgi:hypothetical protein
MMMAAKEEIPPETPKRKPRERASERERETRTETQTQRHGDTLETQSRAWRIPVLVHHDGGRKAASTVPDTVTTAATEHPSSSSATASGPCGSDHRARWREGARAGEAPLKGRRR